MPYETPVAILLLATAFFVLKAFHANDRRGEKGRLTAENIAWPLTVASLAVLFFALYASIRPDKLALTFIAVTLPIFCLATTIDAWCRQTFVASPLKTYRHLRRIVGISPHALSAARAYTMQHFPLGFLAAFSAVTISGLLLLEYATDHAGISIPQALSACVLSIGAWTALDRIRRPAPLSPIEESFLEIDPVIAHSPLQATDRTAHFSLAAKAPCAPGTILLIINESAGMDFPSSEGPSVPLPQKLGKLSGVPEDWFVPSNAVTNSSCTDISIPSLLTGTGAHEDVGKLHRMPFIFDFASARGYRTAVLTSSTMQWANFGLFFSMARIDECFTAETSGLPYINDITVDDAAPVHELIRLIDRDASPLFAVLYTNALHVPFQIDSTLGVPPGLRDRRSRALHIVETGHKMIFDALKRAGRYDDALILTIGDHGEGLDDPTAGKWSVPRVENYGEQVLRPLFMVKPPRALPPHMRAALHANRDALIANVDIAPTLADLLGVSLKEDLAYTGQSLFRRIPDDRLAVALSMNDWRSWPRTGVAFMRGRDRLICDSHDLCEYHRLGEPRLSRGKDDRDKRDAMMTEAFGIPIVRQNIAQIYRNRL